MVVIAEASNTIQQCWLDRSTTRGDEAASSGRVSGPISDWLYPPVVTHKASSPGVMLDYTYEILFTLEETHWWLASRRLIVSGGDTRGEAT
jgi:hypothetical protein